MITGLPHIAKRSARLAIVPVASLALWSCSTAGSDVYGTVPAYNSTANMEKPNAAVAAIDAEAGSPPPASSVPLPSANPTEVAVVAQAPAAGDRPADVNDDSDAAPAAPVQTAAKAEVEPASETASADEPKPQTAVAVADVDPAKAGDGSIATAIPDSVAPPKKTGLLAFFAAKPRSTATGNSDRNSPGAPAAATPTRRNAAVATAPTQVATTATARAAPELNMASLDLPGQSNSSRRSAASDDGGLPGVRQSALFEIKRRSGLDDDSDVDLYEDAPPVRLASAGGLARMSPNGLLKQHDDVDVSCFKPALVRVLKQIEGRFGQKVMVTSGYRNPMFNRKVRGAKNSQHMYCAAADIQVAGVSKWDLAKYVRTLPGRGGVGTYCHTESVHVDIGPERDWNWRCRGRRKA